MHFRSFCARALSLHLFLLFGLSLTCSFWSFLSTILHSFPVAFHALSFILRACPLSVPLSPWSFIHVLFLVISFYHFASFSSRSHISPSYVWSLSPPLPTTHSLALSLPFFLSRPFSRNLSCFLFHVSLAPLSCFLYLSPSPSLRAHSCVTLFFQVCAVLIGKCVCLCKDVEICTHFKI